MVGFAKSSTHPVVLARARPVGQPCMAGAIGQAVDRRIAAEAKILFAWARDRPAASLLAQFEQRAGVSGVDRRLEGGRRLRVERLEHLILQPWHRSPAASLRRLLARRARRAVALFAGQMQ